VCTYAYRNCTHLPSTTYVQHQQLCSRDFENFREDLIIIIIIYQEPDSESMVYIAAAAADYDGLEYTSDRVPGTTRPRVYCTKLIIYPVYLPRIICNAVPTLYSRCITRLKRISMMTMGESAHLKICKSINYSTI